MLSGQSRMVTKTLFFAAVAERRSSPTRLAASWPKQMNAVYVHTQTYTQTDRHTHTHQGYVQHCSHVVTRYRMAVEYSECL